MLGISAIMCFTSGWPVCEARPERRGVVQSVLVGAVIGLAVAMVASVGVLIFIAIRLNRTQKEVSDFLTDTRAELVPALQEMQKALGEVDSAAREVRGKLERADRLLKIAERVVDGTALALTLSRTATGGTLATVIEGAKQAIRVLRRPAGNTEEEGK